MRNLGLLGALAGLLGFGEGSIPPPPRRPFSVGNGRTAPGERVCVQFYRDAKTGAHNPKRRAERAELKTLGMTGKQYRRDVKRRRRLGKAAEGRS